MHSQKQGVEALVRLLESRVAQLWAQPESVGTAQQQQQAMDEVKPGICDLTITDSGPYLLWATCWEGCVHIALLVDVLSCLPLMPAGPSAHHRSPWPPAGHKHGCTDALREG